MVDPDTARLLNDIANKKALAEECERNQQRVEAERQRKEAEGLKREVEWRRRQGR